MSINFNNVRIDLGNGYTLSLSQNFEGDKNLTYSDREEGTVEAGVFDGDRMISIGVDIDVEGYLDWYTLVSVVDRFQRLVQLEEARLQRG